MTIDINILVQTILSGIAVSGIIATWKTASLLAKLEARVDGHEKLDDVRHSEVNRRIDDVMRST